MTTPNDPRRPHEGGGGHDDPVALFTAYVAALRGTSTATVLDLQRRLRKAGYSVVFIGRGAQGGGA